MTAYGRCEHQTEEGVFVAEIRSLNHRYRDIILRLPKNLQVLETPLKSIISSRIRRGRVEASLQMGKNHTEQPVQLELNLPLAAEYHRILEEIAHEFDLDPEVKPETIAQLSDVIAVKPLEVEMDKLASGFEEALKSALDSLDEMRIREGKAIGTDLEKRLALMETYLEDINQRAPNLIQTYRDKLKSKVEAMVGGVEVDESRLSQEVVYFAERSDITEEMVRIRSHLNQFRRYLAEDDALGRRLDFLIQELNREVNTLSAKASDSDISKKVVEMKAELEKLREQVQNVE